MVKPFFWCRLLTHKRIKELPTGETKFSLLLKLRTEYRIVFKKILKRYVLSLIYVQLRNEKVKKGEKKSGGKKVMSGRERKRRWRRKN